MSATYLSPDEIRASFSAAMSAMYKIEVPQYGALLSLVAEINDDVFAHDPALREALHRSGELPRLSVERHGAIRVGTPGTSCHRAHVSCHGNVSSGVL